MIKVIPLNFQAVSPSPSGDQHEICHKDNLIIQVNNNDSDSDGAAELARGEKGGDGFWKMHDMIMSEPKKLDVSVLRGYAEVLGLDMGRFDEVMGDEGKIDLLIGGDFGLAKKCNVRGTPTVFINGVKMANRDIGTYKVRIKQILSGLEKTGG